MNGWQLVMGIAICVIAVGATALAAREGLLWLLPNVKSVHRDVLHLAVIAGAFFLTLRVLHRWGMASELRKKLIECGVPVCERCGYLLRGLPTEALCCPECGAAIDAEMRQLIKRDRVNAHVETQVEPAGHA